MNNDISSIKKQEAIHYFQIDKYDRALDCFFEALSQKPNDGEILFFISNCFYQLEKFQEAIDFCTQALSKDYEKATCNDLLGKIYMETNCFIDAQKCFIEALRINPNSAGTLAAYSCLLLKAGYPKKAKTLLNEALRLEPESYEVLHYCYFYFLVRNKKPALKFTLQKYFEVANSDVDKLIKVGYAKYFAGDYKSVKEAIRQAFLLDPTNKYINEFIKVVEWNGSIALLPQRIIDKVGGPKIIWLIMISSLLVLNFLKAYKIFFVVAISYFVLAIYTWVLAIVLKNKNKRERKNGQN